jgi:alpha-glucosidase
MTFLDAPDGLLAFTRESHGKRLLFVFNTTRTAATFPIKSLAKQFTLLPLPGFIPELSEEGVELEPLDAFCAALG